MSQTTVQNSNCLRFGSGKLQVDAYGANFGALVDLGALRDIKAVESWDEVTIDSNNAGELAARIKKQKLTVDCIWLEPDLAKLNTIRGGDLDNYDPVAGAPVSITDEQAVLTDTNAVRLLNKMGDGTEVGSIVVTTLAAGATVRNTDYVISVDADGYTCIARIAGGEFDDGDIALVDYSYTPSTSKTFSSGGGRELGYCEMRITNTDENAKTLVLDMYRVKVKKGIDITYKADDADDVNAVTMQFEAVLDVTRSATNRDQLYKITDSQGV
jgi:hypothetical protein